MFFAKQREFQNKIKVLSDLGFISVKPDFSTFDVSSGVEKNTYLITQLYMHKLYGTIERKYL